MCNSYASCEECSNNKIACVNECWEYMSEHPECANSVLNEWIRTHPIKAKVRRVKNNGTKKN